MPRRRPRLRPAVFIVSVLLTLALVAVWIDSTRTSTSLSYSVGLGVPTQAEPLPGELQGMWHDTVGTFGVLSNNGTFSLSYIRATFTFYNQPPDAELFRGFKLTRTTRSQRFMAITLLTPPGQLNPFTNDHWFPFLHGFGYSRTNSPTHTRHAFSAPFFLLVVLASLPAGFITFAWCRRRGRHARGSTCPHCGYSRLGLWPSNPCPECGLAPRTAAPLPQNPSSRDLHSARTPLSQAFEKKGG